MPLLFHQSFRIVHSGPDRDQLLGAEVSRKLPQIGFRLTTSTWQSRMGLSVSYLDSHIVLPAQSAPLSPTAYLAPLQLADWGWSLALRISALVQCGTVLSAPRTMSWIYQSSPFQACAWTEPGAAPSKSRSVHYSAATRKEVSAQICSYYATTSWLEYFSARSSSAYVFAFQDDVSCIHQFKVLKPKAQVQKRLTVLGDFPHLNHCLTNLSLGFGRCGDFWAAPSEWFSIRFYFKMLIVKTRK